MQLANKIYVVFFLLISQQLNAQFVSSSNLKQKKIAAKGTIKLDEQSIVPNSLKVEKFDTSFYQVNYIAGTIYFKTDTGPDSVLVTYRTFPLALSKTFQRFNYDSIRNNFMASQPFVFNAANQSGDAGTSFLDFGKINYSGSFGRNLSFGNNQDAVFNSQLNLQMNGLIGDSIELSAALTDNNIPIQPDGTTQRLNEFDKIIIQFKKRNWALSLGDIDVRQNQNYFLNFYKRLQGASYQQETKRGNITRNKFFIAGAIAKGKFTRNVFNGQEGNQGPYRLQGANNEIYFIVLAGTEKVFIDGELLQRGEDQDYVINYNTSELSFTPRRMITKDRRIQIEFEYAERSYLNYMFYVSNEMRLSSKLQLNVAAYSNADAKNSPINQQLDTRQKQFLADIGNDIQNAFYPYENIDSFATTKILYAKRPNPLGGTDSIYVYSTSKDSARYSLAFTEVGANKGNYIPYFNGSNGKVYQWIPPVSGVPQGNYEPAQFLVTPKKQQLITIGTVYDIDKRTTLKTDAAFSNYDVNTFSSINKNESKGYAAKMVLQQSRSINKSLQLNSTLSYEWVELSFKPIERLRGVEFARDWGLPVVTTAATEYLPRASFEIRDKQNNFIQYTADGYFRSDDFTAVRHSLQNAYLIKQWQFKTNLSYTANNTPLLKGFFTRPSVEISKAFPKLNHCSVAIAYNLEHNEQKDKATANLTDLSFAFETMSASIKSNQQKFNKWSVTYFTRIDKLPYQKELQSTDRSYNYNLLIELLQNQSHQVRFNATYRELKILNGSLTTQKPDNSLLARVEYNINEWKGFVTGYVLYELGAGQEQRRDFSYLEVPAGRGQYTWNDYNADGIAQLNEFEIALFPDQAKYIRIFTPTNQFIKANYTQFNYHINLNPRSISTGISNVKFRNLIARFTLQSSLQASKKSLSDGNIEINPFNKNIADTSLISLSNIFSNMLSFNRSSPVWGIDITHVNNNSKALLTYGLESRQIQDFTFRGRVNIQREYSLELVQKWGSNELTTASFSNRNYFINVISTEPRIIYTNQTKYRVLVSYQYNRKQNAIQFGGEESVNNSLNIEAKYNSVGSTSITSKFTLSNIQYSGTGNTTISYIMLDGLLPGKNYLWNIDFTKRLSNNFEISFSYEGRKPGESRVINIGRASVRAIL